MDESMLLNGVLGSLFGGRRKRSGRALRHLTRGTMGVGSGLLGAAMSHPMAALTAAGVAWGIFETLQGNSGQGGQTSQWGNVGGGLNQGAGGVNPGGGAPPPVPPLPQMGPPGVSSDVLRLVRLAISAANADGAMNDAERAAVIAKATEAGVANIVEQELQQPRPLAEIVGGVTDPAHRATLYVLAFSVLRADEAITGAERIYLAQLAHLLYLDPPTVQKLEADAAARIDATED
jgi:uncharacterized membrane protein YebE (DUF533 family)